MSQCARSSHASSGCRRRLRQHGCSVNNDLGRPARSVRALRWASARIELSNVKTPASDAGFVFVLRREVVPVLTTKFMAPRERPHGTCCSTLVLRVFFEISGFCRASSAGKDTEMSVEIARSGLTACAHPGAGQRSHRERSQRRWWRSVVAVLWRPPGAHLYGGGGRKFEIVPTSPDRVSVALGLSAGLVHSAKCEKLRDPTVGRLCCRETPAAPVLLTSCSSIRRTIRHRRPAIAFGEPSVARERRSPYK